MEKPFFMGLHIQVLDDNPFYATLLEHQLNYQIRQAYDGHADHFKVTSFTDYHKFLEALPATHSISLVDYNLGNGITGIDVMKEIRRQAPNSKVIIMTGENNAHVLPNCLATGANGFIFKDHATVELCQMIIHRTISSSNFPYQFLF